MPSSTLPLSFPSGKGLAKGRYGLVEESVLEDGPERTISVSPEHVAGGSDGEGRSDLDSHVGHRRVSADNLRRVESLTRVGRDFHRESQPEGQGALQQRIRRVHGSKCPISIFIFSRYDEADEHFCRISQDLALDIAVQLTSEVCDTASGH